ncbi:CHAT domain-containing protein [Streptomyces sp. 2A115]|uniref:CHAT domain-containing protein n=1 Tax=Streptomyces sp. 2A115 TaxID=3457439 RepID=UPI003FD251EC
MLTLRISLTRAQTGISVNLALADSGQIEIANSDFTFGTTGQDDQNIRWYLEDYLKYPADPAPAMAKRIEERLRKMGQSLFSEVFGSPRARYIWSIIRPCLGETRIEVTEGSQTPDIPWECMLDPETGRVLSLSVAAFVRTYPGSSPARISTPQGEHIRILLAICRPAGKSDVGFRAVARHIVDQFHATPSVAIDVLRPPTFARLASILQTASESGRPYHVVHFDGHGGWENPGDSPDSLPRGLIAFESTSPRIGEFIDGSTMGRLLRHNEVPILLLNSCRSARRDSFETAGPDKDEGDDSVAHIYRSFAQEVCEAGVAGVLAMRYNIYVVTAAQFIGDVYAALLGSETLGEAVTSGRRQLAERPLREVTSSARPLQDWIVPVVYEGSPLALFEIAGRAPVTPPEDARSPELTARPRFGFLGRDDALFDLDRAFTSHPTVLLHGYAGEGKTATAAEFARWYARTGGTKGPMLYTSFELGQSVRSLAEQVCTAFEHVLDARGVRPHLFTENRRELAKSLVAEFRPLWIWDSFELATDREDDLTLEYGPRSELVDFLAELRGAGGRTLIVSRRPEPWLQDAVFRVALDPMPLMERLQLARAVARSLGADFGGAAKWLDFLRYTQGNPFTIITVLSQALKSDSLTKEDIDGLVSRLRSGEASVGDEADSSERAAAAVNEFLTKEFSPPERRFLATLSLFRQFVDGTQLLAMNPVLAEHYPGNEPPEYNLREVVLDEDHPLHSLTNLHPESIAPLLSRCMEGGLLTPWKINDQPLQNAYYIHPAFAWHLAKIFKDTFVSTASGSGRDVVYCFVGAYAQMGSTAQYAMAEESSMRSMFLTIFQAEEHNLGHALKLAIRHQWWGFIPDIAEGLRLLYRSNGRLEDWDRVVTEITPLLLDEELRPLPGREDLWKTLIHYRIDVAATRRDWRQIVSLAGSLVDQLRTRPADADAVAHSYSLANALKARGEALSLLEQEGESLTAIREAVEIYRSVKDPKQEASALFMLGNVHRRRTDPVGLNEAEHCYLQSTQLGDRENGINCLEQLAAVSFKRFINLSKTVEPDSELMIRNYLEATQRYTAYIALQPEGDVHHRAVGYSQLGMLAARVTTETPLAIAHFHRAIELFEFEGDRYQAGHIKQEISTLFGVGGHYEEALLYARAALADFETYGAHARDSVESVMRMISGIERLISQRDG